MQERGRGRAGRGEGGRGGEAEEAGKGVKEGGRREGEGAGSGGKREGGRDSSFICFISSLLQLLFSLWVLFSSSFFLILAFSSRTSTIYFFFLERDPAVASLILALA